MPRHDTHALNMFRIGFCQMKDVAMLNIRTDEC